MSYDTTEILSLISKQLVKEKLWHTSLAITTRTQDESDALCSLLATCN